MRLSGCFLWFVVAAFLFTACSGDTTNDDPDSGVRFEQNNKSPNSTQTGDVGIMTRADCGVEVCAVGETRCAGADIESCVPDPEGCLHWERSGCPGNEVCAAGVCTDAPDCIDTDQDGYGTMCPAGDDCNDNDININPGAVEVCDNVDNNCDQQTDEGFGIGQPCTSGMGACAVNGFTQCNAAGTATECDAQPAQGDPETCDGLDNDCDGVIDNGDVCTVCNGDPNEPNNNIGTATPIIDGGRGWLAVCPGDVDFFQPAVTVGQTYRMTVKFPEFIADLKMDAYVNGAMDSTSDTPSFDEEGFQFTAMAGETYNFSIVNKDAVEGIYYVRFSNINSIACNNDDAFAPNYDINSAPLFLPGWWTNGYICFGSTDWYRMENIQAGERIIIDVDAIDFVDFDLYLWGDPDGDNTFSVIDSATGFTFSEFISITAPYTGLYFYEVRALGDFGQYDTRFTAQ